MAKNIYFVEQCFGDVICLMMTHYKTFQRVSKFNRSTVCEFITSKKITQLCKRGECEWLIFR
jgi:hypothetical protein